MRTTDPVARRPLGALLACALLAAVLALAACGGDGEEAADPTDTGAAIPGVTVDAPEDASDDSASVPDPCELLTEEEVAEAIGETQVTAAPGRGGQPSGLEDASCAWTGPAPEAGAIATPKMVLVDIYAGEEHWADWPDSEPLSGIGDEAFLSAPLDSVAWRQGDLVLVLQYVVIDGTPAAELEALA
jgi:Protein of unknown function (DUF3558)